MSRCVCCSRPPSCLRSPPSADSPRPLPGWRSELRRQGVDVELIVPDYGDVELSGETTIELDVPAWAHPARIRVGDHPVAGRLHLVDVPGMARSHPYLRPDGDGWPDNAERFFRFARAIAARVEQSPPDVLHLNDWHTGAALAALTDPTADGPVDPQPRRTRASRRAAWLRRIGPRAEHYEWWGSTNPFTGAIALADAIVAVSPTYAKEILTPELGCGIDRPLAYRGDALTGILNGIDTTVWDPSTDRHIVSTVRRRPARRQGAESRRAPRASGFRRSRRSARGRGDASDRPERDRPPRAARAAARADPDAAGGAGLR